MKRISVLISVFIVILLVSCCPRYDPYPSRNYRQTGRLQQPQVRVHTRNYSLGTGRNTYFHFHGKHGRYFSAYNLGNLLDSLIYGSGTGRMGGTRINIR